MTENMSPERGEHHLIAVSPVTYSETQDRVLIEPLVRLSSKIHGFEYTYFTGDYQTEGVLKKKTEELQHEIEDRINRGYKTSVLGISAGGPTLTQAIVNAKEVQRVADLCREMDPEEIRRMIEQGKFKFDDFVGIEGIFSGATVGSRQGEGEKWNEYSKDKLTPEGDLEKGYESTHPGYVGAVENVERRVAKRLRDMEKLGIINYDERTSAYAEFYSSTRDPHVDKDTHLPGTQKRPLLYPTHLGVILGGLLLHVPRHLKKPN